MISAPLAQIASSLLTDPSALESSISALERDVSALDSAAKSLEISSACWEPWVWVFSALVVVGVVMELWLVRHDWREESEIFAIWHFVGVIRSPSRPYRIKLLVEVLSIVFIAIGVAGELGIGVKISLINGAIRGIAGELRTKNAELRNKSERLIAILNKQVEDERLARVQLEQTLAWRKLTPHNEFTLHGHLIPFAGRSVVIWYNAGDAEGSSFAWDIAKVLHAANWKVFKPASTTEYAGFPTPFIATTDLPKLGIEVKTKSDSLSKSAGVKLAKSLDDLGFDSILVSNFFLDKAWKTDVWVDVRTRPPGAQGDAKIQMKAAKK
ncbi:MAG: hypothetical protein ABSD75_08485 [Terriglobales bacterium]